MTDVWLLLKVPNILIFQPPGVCMEMAQIASTSVIVWTTQNVADHVLVAVIQLP